MKIRFSKGYRGWATNEAYYRPGDEAEVSDAVATYLCGEMGVAKEVTPPKRKKAAADKDGD